MAASHLFLMLGPTISVYTRPPRPLDLLRDDVKRPIRTLSLVAVASFRLPRQPGPHVTILLTGSTGRQLISRIPSLTTIRTRVMLPMANLFLLGRFCATVPPQAPADSLRPLLGRRPRQVVLPVWGWEVSATSPIQLLPSERNGRVPPAVRAAWHISSPRTVPMEKRKKLLALILAVRGGLVQEPIPIRLVERTCPEVPYWGVLKTQVRRR